MADDILCACSACGKEFAGHAGKANKFCGVGCYRKAQRSGVYKSGHGPTFPRAPCHQCGKITARIPSKRRDGTQSDKVFCSRSCYDKSRMDRRPPCACCGKRVPVVSARYCSMACRIKGLKPKPCTCLSCGVKFSAIKWQEGRMVAYSSASTCSHACHIAWIKSNPERKRKISEAFRLDKHPGWLGGSHREGFRGHAWKQIAEQVRERAHRCCEHCGMAEAAHLVKFKMRLNVNHIEPFHQHKNKSYANRLSNLEALCKPCHTRTDWKWRKEHPMQITIDFRCY